MELNAFEPVLFYNIFESIETLTGAVNTLTNNCVTGITANEKECRSYVQHSVGISTALCPYIGYKKSAEISKLSLKTGRTVKEIVLSEKLLSESQLNEILNPVNLTEPENEIETIAKAM